MPDRRPSFSIVVPTYRRPRQLAACLGSLAALEYPAARFEVIVVDDDFDAPLESTVEAHRERLSTTLVRTPHRGPAAARNAGALRAEGSLLAFIDDDCLADRRWLEALAASASAAPGCAIGGRIVNVGQDVCAPANQLILDCVYAYYNSQPARARFFASDNMAVPAAAFRAIGGFDASFTTSEDRDLCDRWLGRGRGLVYAPDAVVYHDRVSTVGSFFRQHFNYGRGARRFHRRRRGSPRDDLAFYRTVMSRTRAALRHGSALDRATLVGLLSGWQVMNAAGFAWEAVTARAAASGSLTAGSST